MKQISDFRYEVSPGEQIKLVFKPIGITPSTITAALDEGPIDPNPDKPNPTYTFSASLPEDQTHFFKVECDFVGADDSARVDVEITGQSGQAASGPFTFSINNADSIHDPTIRFRVKSAGQ
jgi:hypothetical protein